MRKVEMIPPFSGLLAAYERYCPTKELRVGQWFFNTYLLGTEQIVRRPYNYEALYNSTDFHVIFDILHSMYKDYQWPMAPETP